MLSNFKAKPKNETIKIKLSDDGDFIELKSMSDKKFVDEIGRKSTSTVKAWKKSAQNVKDDKEVKIFCAAIARHLIVDWQLTNNKNEFKKDFPDIAIDSRAGLDKELCNVPFTFDNAYKILTHKEYEDFFSMVFEEIRDKAQFEIIALGKDIKN